MAAPKIHFEISERKVLLRLFDILSVLFSLYVVGQIFKFDYFYITKENWTWCLVLVVYLMIFGTVFELYDLQKASKADKTLPNVILTAFLTVLVYLLTPFYTPVLPENRLQILFFFLAITEGLGIWRAAYITLIASPRFFKNVIVVGEISNIQTIVETFRQPDPHYNIVGFVNCETSQAQVSSQSKITEYKPDELLDVIASKGITEVVVATYNPENITPKLYNDLTQLLERGFPIKEYTQVYEELANRVPMQFVGKDFYRYFPFSRNNSNKLYQLYNTVFNYVFSMIGLVFALAVLPLVLLGNLLGNRGPLFYRQERVGKNGKPFNILKFRTMVKNAESETEAVWANKGDSRITPFGNFMRRTRLDELPQFINVLKGEMNIIGPRPERPYFVKELSKVIPFYETRHIIKPGLSGWAQVKMRYGSSVEDSLLKLQYDLYYIKHRSFLLDMNILLKTVSSVVYYRGQ